MTTLNGLAGCTETLSALHPAGPAAREIATLWTVMLIGAVGIFLFVMLLLVMAWRGKGAHAGDRVWFWGLGLAFPLVTLTALTAYGLVLGERLRPVASPDVVVVRAEARQWAWSFGYADAPGITTADILHIPAGRPVDVEITSRDVVHAFWVPRLAGKLDAIPGRTNRLRIEADLPGDYAGASAEFSGTGYRDHVFTVRAHDPAAWAAFLTADLR
jgi:cytochrome c oxidase subunit 2/cytochrome aa3-600 menaquinol oxidase subunit 2